LIITKLSQEVIKYATEYCLGKIKDEDIKDPMFANLMFAYLDDANSSTLREAITANMCGYTWLSEKLGADAIDDETKELKEIKPKRHTKGRFRGAGNFSDLTPERIAQYKKESYGIISSFFIGKKIGYVIEFKMSDIIDCLEKQVIKKCIVEKNKYARSVSFDYKDWIDSPHIKLHYIDLPLLRNANCMAKEFQYKLELKFNNDPGIFE